MSASQTCIFRRKVPLKQAWWDFSTQYAATGVASIHLLFSDAECDNGDIFRCNTVDCTMFAVRRATDQQQN